MFERIARTYVKHLPWEIFVSKSDNLEVRLVTLSVFTRSHYMLLDIQGCGKK